MNTIQRNKVSDYLEQHKQEYLNQNWESTGRKVIGTFYTPDNICELIEAISRLYNPKTVIDICCGTGNLLSYFGDLQVVKGIDINPEVISLAQKILPSIDFVQADTLEYDFGSSKYDLVLGSLPFGLKLSNQEPLEEQLIRKGLELLNQDGTAIFIVPQRVVLGFTYRNLRTYLIENFALDIIVSSPDDALIQTSIFVIRKGNPNQQVFMPVFDENISSLISNFQNKLGEVYVDPDKIKIKNRLDRNLYLSLKSIEEKQNKYKTVKLSDVATIVRGESFSQKDFKSSGKYLVFYRQDYRQDREGGNFVDNIKNNQCILKDNDFIISLVSRSGKVGDSISIYRKTNDYDVVISKNYVVIRPIEDSDYQYLNYLQTNEGKLSLELTKSLLGTAGVLSVRQLAEIRIPLISAKEFNKLLAQDRKEIKDNITRYVELLKQESYLDARYLVEENFNDYSEEEKRIYINFIAKEEEIKDKNRELEEKEKELEDVMSMFAHKFRSPLQAIIHNTTHEKTPKVYIEAAQTMGGLLNIFSIISTDDKLLKEKLKDDMQGKGRLIDILNSTLKMTLLHLLSVSAVNKIRQHYMSYAIQQGKVDNQTTRKIWYDDYYKLESSLQLEWEESFSNLISHPFNLDDQLKWIEQHFFKLEAIGFDREDIQFEEYGVTESFLVILLNEIIVNAFKYYASDNKKSVVLQWVDNGDHQTIECHNPSTRSERTRIKGDGKGHTFLSTLARKTNIHFIKPVYQDDFVIRFNIPTQFLTNTF